MITTVHLISSLLFSPLHVANFTQIRGDDLVKTEILKNICILRRRDSQLNCFDCRKCTSHEWNISDQMQNALGGQLPKASFLKQNSSFLDTFPSKIRQHWFHHVPCYRHIGSDCSHNEHCKGSYCDEFCWKWSRIPWHDGTSQRPIEPSLIRRLLLFYSSVGFM